MNGKRNTWFTVVAAAAMVAILAFAVWAALPQVRAQGTTTAVASQPRTITVVGEGAVKIKPDTAIANLGVETMGETVKQATTLNSETMTAVMAALKAQGIADADIQTSGFNVWLDRNPSPEAKDGMQATYRVNNNVSVTIRDLSKVGAVLDAVIEAGANSIYGVSFTSSVLQAGTQPNAVMAEAREKAVADALAKANELAKLNGVKVSGVVSVSEVIANNGGYYPGGLRAMDASLAGKGGGGVGPISPGELEVTAQLQVVYAIQ